MGTGVNAVIFLKTLALMIQQGAFRGFDEILWHGVVRLALSNPFGVEIACLGILSDPISLFPCSFSGARVY